MGCARNGSASFVPPVLRLWHDYMAKRQVEGPEGGTPHVKGVAMLVVSIRGVNFGIIFSREAVKVSFRVAREKI